MNKKILITIGILGIFLFSAFLFTLKCQGKIVPFETVSKGEGLGYLNNETMQPIYTILTNKNELDSFLDKFGAHAKEVINFSENDFKGYILICAYFGYAPSTGYEIEIKEIVKIVKKDRTVDVIIQFRVPKYGETQLTSPYHIVKVKRTYFELGKHIFVFKDTAGKELNRVEMEFKEGIISAEEVISANGTIKYISLEKGFYGIITDEGEKYLPLNLPEEFKKEGLRVWFKAKPKKVATIRMWGKPIEILEIKLIEVQNLSQIRVAILYERITDGIYHLSKIRTYKDLVKILNETNPDLVFRVWWRWTPTPESLPSNSPVYQAGHTYQQLEETLRKLKKDLPEIKYWFGAIPTQRINFEEKNPITGKTYSQNETWQMALDPQKWRINFSKEKLQELAQEKGGTGKHGYFPDVTNKEFQELYLSWAKRQIDAGVNGLFLDMLFAQPRILAKITENPEHPAVKDSLEAIDYLIKEIRDYGKKKGKYIYLCSFGTFTDFPGYTPDLDFVLVSLTIEEIRNLALDEERWDEIVSKIKERLPKAKILAVIDWAGTTNTPLGVFSQELSKEEQREFLKIADEFFSKKGIIFVYPVHGGFMGQDARILSFGKLKTYDSLAPEFQTYKTIKELAQSKR